MNYFADTSFLCAIYRTEIHSRRAEAFSESYRDQIVLSSLIGFEFRQSIRLQIRQHATDKTVGIGKEEANRILNRFQSHTQTEVFKLLSPAWAEVHTLAEILSAKYTETEGHRFADILHVATALQLGCRGFLTFDAGQRHLARAEGLEAPI
jgi:predicted nucleic acid-binding protein